MPALRLALRSTRGHAGAALLAGLRAAGSAAAPIAPAAAPELRVAVLSANGTDGAGVSETAPRAAARALLASAGIRLTFMSCRPDPLGKLAVQDAAVILLDEDAAGALTVLLNDELRALEAAVAAGGTGLVVLGRAAAALPRSEKFARLLGRIEPSPDAATLPNGLALQFPDQSHPLTQCITDLIFEHHAPTAAGASWVGHLARAVPLAEGARAASAPAGTPPAERQSTVIWTRQLGNGRVAVIALDAAPGGRPPPREPGVQPAPAAAAAGGESPGAAGREAAAVAVLLARALEWTAGRGIASRLPDALPLLAERLADHDSLPDFPASTRFFRGREIAPVMGYQAIDWLLRPDREETELPEKVLEALAIARGATVADLGAGAGYFTFRLARRVGPEGKVIAADLQEEMLAALKARMEKEGVRNIELVQSTETDPRLPEGAVDLVLMVDVYHELAQPRPVVERLVKSLRRKGPGVQGGRLVLVEYRGEDPAVPIKPLHRMTAAQARAELAPLGFRWVETKGFLPHQHILIFEAAGD